MEIQSLSVVVTSNDYRDLITGANESILKLYMKTCLIMEFIQWINN
jgi:hypothetical protein